MTETRICPVCENEIPEEMKFRCPNCWLDLQKLTDVEYVANYRGIFKEQKSQWWSFRWEYFFSGLGGSAMFLALGYIFDIVELEFMPQYIFPWFMSGFLAGIIGTSIDNQSYGDLSTKKSIGIAILSAFIGIFSFLCNIFGND